MGPNGLFCRPNLHLALTCTRLKCALDRALQKPASVRLRKKLKVLPLPYVGKGADQLPRLPFH